MKNIMKRIHSLGKSILASILVLTLFVSSVIAPWPNHVQAEDTTATHVITEEASDGEITVRAIYDWISHQFHLVLIQDGEEHTFEVEILDILDENNAKLRIIDENGESILMGFGTFQSNLRNKRAIPLLLAVVAGTVGRQVAIHIINRLIQAGLLLYVGEQAFIVVTEMLEDIRKQKEYRHYQARIIKGDVYIGKGLTFDEAVKYLLTSGKQGGVWSVTKDEAENLAMVAGGGLKPEGPEKHCNRKTGSDKGYYYHYHILGHIGGHSWYAE